MRFVGVRGKDCIWDLQRLMRRRFGEGCGSWRRGLRKGFRVARLQGSEFRGARLRGFEFHAQTEVRCSTKICGVSLRPADGACGATRVVVAHAMLELRHCRKTGKLVLDAGTS